MIGLIDDGKEDVGQDEDEEYVEGEEEYHCHGGIDPVKVLIIEFTNSNLEAHPDRPAYCVIPLKMLSKAHVPHPDESKHQHQEYDYEKECILSRPIQSIGKHTHLLALVKEIEDLHA